MTAEPGAPGLPTPGLPTPGLPTPGLRRRMACFVYEGVLLFGVLMIAGLLYGTLTQQRHALSGLHGLQLFVFAVLGAYFSWFWSHGGQTVAMKTWHIRLVGLDGHAVSQTRALARYLLSWLWFLPALTWAYIAGLKSVGEILALVLAGIAAYAALTRLQPQRQYLHDVICATRLVSWNPPAAARGKDEPTRPTPDARSAAKR